MKNKFNKIKQSTLIKLSLLSLVLTPFIIFAAEPPKDLAGFFKIITNLIAKSIVPLIFTLAFMFFIWGVVQYVLYPDDEGKKEKGRSFMIWGLIALTVMFSVWGLVTILTGTFGIDPSVVPHLPETPN